MEIVWWLSPGRRRKMRHRRLWQRSSIALRSVFNILRNGNPVPVPDFLFRKNISLAQTVCRDPENTQVHPPVPNEWFERFNLPIQDADVLEQDPDGDGFTNLDEWQGGTDPTNKDSHPDYLTKLHLVSATEEQFRFHFCIMGWRNICA